MAFIKGRYIDSGLPRGADQRDSEHQQRGTLIKNKPHSELDIPAYFCPYPLYSDKKYGIISADERGYAA